MDQAQHDHRAGDAETSVMNTFRILLWILVALILIFTITAVAQGGLNFITPFFAPLPSLTWQAQFHLDFALYLFVSALWMAWRSGFSRAGLALACLCAPLGMLFFAPYLIYLLGQTKGDMRALLLGVHTEA